MALTLPTQTAALTPVAPLLDAAVRLDHAAARRRLHARVLGLLACPRTQCLAAIAATAATAATAALAALAALAAFIALIALTPLSFEGTEVGLVSLLY